MANFDDLQGAVAQFGEANKVVYDDTGMPSIMVGVPKMKYSDLITGGTDETLPFWIVDGEEKDTIWVSKFANIVENDRAYSLGMKLPQTYITFEEALEACRKKGNGWHLNQTGVFACLDLLSRRMGTTPHGNTNHGKDYNYPYEHGIMPQEEENKILTGSGTPTWYHNHDTSGIADLCGNVWEWTGGLRLLEGEIQIIPYGNSMKLDCDMSAGSTLWKAIMPDGSLVAPGTTGTLKVDRTGENNDILRINTIVTTRTTENNSMNVELKRLQAVSGVTIPKLLIALGLYPDSEITGCGGYGGDRFYARNNDERLPVRGGAYGEQYNGGTAAVNLHYQRGDVRNFIGFRAGFANL